MQMVATKDLEELDIREHGVSENEISIIEKCFDVNIVLLTKGEDGQGGIYRDSCYRHDADTSKVIYLDLYEDWEGRGFKYRWLH